MLKVSDVMTRGPMLLDIRHMLLEATTRMRELELRHLPVIDGARLAGMLTDRDILNYQAHHPGESIEGVPVSVAMGTEALTVGPDEPAATVAAAMYAQGLDVAMVVAEGRIAGIFTTTDALHALATGAADAVPAAARIWPRRVLCAVDFSAASRGAFAVALRLAGVGGEITLFHAHVGSARPPAIEQRMRAWIREVPSLGTNAVAVAMSAGAPAEAIIAHARQGGFDLVVVGSHGRSGAKRLLLGSVAESVAREAPCPVLVVRHA